jgi:C-terminal peptidase prc
MTKARLMLALLGTLAAMALATPTRADGPGAPATYLIVVGIDKYDDPQIKPRAHAEADAKALYDLLTSKDHLGTPDAKLLLGKDATHKTVTEAFKWAASNAKARDTVIVAWFGEGGPLGKSGDRRCYFVSDSNFKERDKTAVGADEIGDLLKDLKAQRLVGFLDVNFKGFDAPGQNVAEPDLSKAPYKEFLGDDESEDHNAVPGRVLFLANAGLKPSLDLADHGVFGKVIVDGLKGAADKEGYEADGNVTIDELTEYLDKELPDLVRQHGKTKEEKQQLPLVLSGTATHFVLTHNPEAWAKAQKRVAAFDALVKSGKVPAKIADEGRGMLERMPRLKSQQQLRKDYQALVDANGAGLDKFLARRTELLDASRITEIDATKWAKKVMDVVDIMKENHVKETKPGEMVGWAVRGLYRVIDEKVPADVEGDLKDVKDVKDDEKLTVLLAKARLHLGKREDLADDKDLSIALRTMLGHLDPYTTFYDKEALQKFDDEIRGNFPGIGIQIRKDAETDYLLVVTPIKGSPAYRAGLQAGDLITTVTREVDGATGKPLATPEVLQTKGMLLTDAVKKIKGLAGTKVKLTIKREGVDKPIEVEITRGIVEVDTVLGYKRKPNDDWDFYVDPQAKIGYIRLTQFSRNSYRDLKNVMDDLSKQGLKGFILDLRFNPGGLLDSAVKMTDLYVDDGLIVTIRPRVGRAKPYRGETAGSMLDFPMVCLVNGQSASGSEIVSAALQDHKRALIVGERSYGKGSVQNIVPYPKENEGELKLTTATFWRPSGKNLNRATAGKDGGYGKDEDTWGVTPDKVVPLSRKDTGDLYEYLHELEVIRPKDKPMKDTGFKDRQLEAALSYLRDQIKMASR